MREWRARQRCLSGRPRTPPLPRTLPSSSSSAPPGTDLRELGRINFNLLGFLVWDRSCLGWFDAFMTTACWFEIFCNVSRNVQGFLQSTMFFRELILTTIIKYNCIITKLCCKITKLCCRLALAPNCYMRLMTTQSGCQSINTTNYHRNACYHQKWSIIRHGKMDLLTVKHGIQFENQRIFDLQNSCSRMTLHEFSDPIFGL